MSQRRADVVLDARGMACPQPVLLARGLLRQMQPGQVLEIIGNDPCLQENIVAFTGRSGDELLESEQGEGQTRHFLRRA